MSTSRSCQGNYLGKRDYSIRAWLNPEKLAALNITAGEVATTIRNQNLQPRTDPAPSAGDSTLPHQGNTGMSPKLAKKDAESTPGADSLGLGRQLLVGKTRSEIFSVESRGGAVV